MISSQLFPHFFCYFALKSTVLCFILMFSPVRNFEGTFFLYTISYTWYCSHRLSYIHITSLDCCTVFIALAFAKLLLHAYFLSKSLEITGILQLFYEQTLAVTDFCFSLNVMSSSWHWLLFNDLFGWSQRKL